MDSGGGVGGGVDQVCGGEDRRANGGFIQEGDAREVGVEAAGWWWWGGWESNPGSSPRRRRHHSARKTLEEEDEQNKSREEMKAETL